MVAKKSENGTEFIKYWFLDKFPQNYTYAKIPEITSMSQIKMLLNDNKREQLIIASYDYG